MRICILCLMIVSCSGYAAVTTKVDRFTGSTTFEAFHVKPYSPLRPQIIVTLGKDKSIEAVIDLAGSYHDWKYLSCHDTHWLLDGKPFAGGAVHHDGSVGNGYVVEHITQPLTAPELQMFAASKKIEFEVCNDAGEFTAEEMQDLREIATKVK